ncbi:hypothetical protein BV509_11855 [Rhodovulum sulfidophilum]|nr:hypothetical protein BV509_11855 [Rhodovulum sulfidophilum]
MRGLAVMFGHQNLMGVSPNRLHALLRVTLALCVIAAFRTGAPHLQVLPPDPRSVLDWAGATIIWLCTAGLLSGVGARPAALLLAFYLLTTAVAIRLGIAALPPDPDRLSLDMALAAGLLAVALGAEPRSGRAADGPGSAERAAYQTALDEIVADERGLDAAGMGRAQSG